MNNNKEIFNKIEEQYNLIKAYHNKYLKKYGVVLPKLYDKDKKITKNALVLIFLSLGYPNTRRVSKTELTKFVRKFYPSVNDVQQARHLGAQDGWYIAAGGRDNIVVNLKKGEYQLYTLEEPYPHFKKSHRVDDSTDMEKIKVYYSYRCATCGSRGTLENLSHSL